MDEWRWTFEHLNVPNHLPGLGCNGKHAQERGHGSNQSCVHAAFLSKGTRKVKIKCTNDPWRICERGYELLICVRLRAA
jgi:hypothetical protein